VRSKYRIGKRCTRAKTEAALGRHHGQVLLAVERDELGDDGAREQQGEPPEPGRVVARDEAVEADLEEIGLEQAEPLLDRREQQRRPHHGTVRPDELPETPEEAGVVRLADLFLVADRQIASSSPSRDCCRNRSAYTPPRSSSAS
jgi:hypothetical protein